MHTRLVVKLKETKKIKAQTKNNNKKLNSRLQFDLNWTEVLSLKCSVWNLYVSLKLSSNWRFVIFFFFYGSKLKKGVCFNWLLVKFYINEYKKEIQRFFLQKASFYKDYFSLIFSFYKAFRCVAVFSKVSTFLYLEKIALIKCHLWTKR